MPQLSVLQWLIVAVFQAFYGFAVFALTRDHYQRQPVQAVAAAPMPQATPAARAIAEQALTGSAIPENVVGNDPQLLARLGDERFGQKRYDEAIAIYRKVLRLNPKDVDTHNDLGLALRYSGQIDEALQILKRGAEIDPTFQRIWLTLGFVQLGSAESGEAKYALQEALRLGPDNSIGQEAQRLLGKTE